MLAVLRFALTSGAMVRWDPAGELESVAGHVALVRFATERLSEFFGSENPDDRGECQEVMELLQRNLAGIVRDRGSASLHIFKLLPMRTREPKAYSCGQSDSTILDIIAKSTMATIDFDALLP